MKQFLQKPALALLCVSLHTVVAQGQGPTLDPAFALTSVTRTVAYAGLGINDMVRQPDGKIIVGGDMATLNGVAVSRVARLLPNGQVDATYNVSLIDGSVLDLVLQTDGKLLVGGRFTDVSGQPRFGLARLLPDGTLDAGFVPVLGRTAFYASDVNKIILQPGAGIIVSGSLVLPAGVARTRLARLTETTGALDPTFPTFSLGFDIFDVLPQPNGNLVFASSPRLLSGQVYNVWGTLPDGTLDPAFVPLPGMVNANGLVRDPRTGNIYVAEAARGAGLHGEPVRLLPNGTLDPTFNTTGAFIAGVRLPPGNSRSRRGYAASLAIQPNGRLLLGGDFALGGGSYVGSWRLMPSGARDPSYQVSNGPEAAVNTVVVQPDGALLFCGPFNQAGGATPNCLTRMLDPNVLAISKQQAQANLVAWPVPAHDVLHLRLAPGPGPLRVALLDALGREVQQQAVAAGQTALTLPTAGLPPGAYLLRVAYPTGPVLRRVAVE